MAETSGQYCPIIHMGPGLAVAERLNDMFGVSPDDIETVLRRAYSYDKDAMLPSDAEFNIDNFFNTEGMKFAMSQHFGYGKSTFIVHTKEEYDSYTELYNRFQKNGYIDENGVMTVGGLKNIDEFYNAFAGQDDYETVDRIHFWKDSQGNSHGALSKPVLAEIEEVTTYFDEIGDVREKYKDQQEKDKTARTLEEISPADLRGSMFFMGLTPSDIAHNKAIMKEAFEKAAAFRKSRLDRASEMKENRSPMNQFRAKFTDKNMLNFLAEVAARRISNIVSELQDDRRAKYKYMSRFPNVDFTKLSRKEILKNQDYFNVIKKAAKQMEFARRTGTYNIETGDYDFNNPVLDDILEMIYDGRTGDINNFDLLLQHGKRLLRQNEGLILQENSTLIDANDEDQTDTEDQENAQIQYEEGEGGDVEEDNQYKLAEPSVPAARKITDKIKLMLGNIPNIGTIEYDDGTTDVDVISDPWGFGYSTFLNPGKAVNTILNITSGADTIKEMLERLDNNKVAFPWLNYVIDRISNKDGSPLQIDKEKLQNEFFASFRKDKTIFTGTSVTEMPDGTVRFRYTERNRGAEARKEKANLRSKFEKREGMPLFKNNAIDFSGDFNSNPFWFIRIGFDPRNNSRSNNILLTLSDLYYNDPGSLYDSIDPSMKNRESTFTRIFNALHHFGIKCSPTAFYAMAMADKEGGVERFEDTNIGRIVVNLFSIAYRLNNFNPSRQDAIPYYNPFNWDERLERPYRDQIDLAGPYNDIIDTIEAFTESNTESVAHVDGKAHYAFNYPTFLQTTITKLANKYGTRDRLNQFFNDRYNNDWYSYVDDNNKRHYYLDILEQVNRGTNTNKLEYVQKLDLNGVDYKKMSPRGYTMAILSDYFTQMDRSTAVYRAPIASDKPAMDGIRWIRYNDHSNSENNFKTIITSQAWNIALQEINRSRRVLQRAIEGKKPIANFDIKLKNKKEKEQLQVIIEKMTNGEDVVFSDLFVNGKYLFRRAGVGFKFIRLMNDVLLNTNRSDKRVNEFQKAIIDTIFNGSDSIKEYHDTFDMLFQGSMTNRVNNDWAYLHDIGVFDTVPIRDDVDDSEFYVYKNLEFLAMEYAKHNGLVEKIDGQYPDYLPRNVIDDVIRDMLEEFVYNNFIIQIQMTELFGVDLAYYKGTTDFQKRSAQTRSTGQKLNKSATIFGKEITDGKLRTITVNSIKHKSYSIDNIKSVLENYANTITDAREKASFKQSIPDIIKMYDEVDATDGQAWNSISGLRKKHIMAAKWSYEKDDARIGERQEDGSIFLNEGSDTDEAVYRRMKLGRPINKDFFHVFTQVDKPFVYDTSVRDGAPVPLQQKNAEYTYVLVNQFMSNFTPSNPLTVLIRAIEKTHERNNKTYVTGIDTVNFDSSVKVGTRDGFDMSTDISALTKQLNDILHIDKDLDDNQYENEWVDEIDVNSYAYQQNNPEHFIDHSQLLGSQEKILAVANTRDNDVLSVDGNLTALRAWKNVESLTGKELKNSYFDVLTQRTVLSEKMLRDELSLDNGERTKFAAISDKLKKSLVLGKKYSEDDVRAVSIMGRNFLLGAEDATQAANIKAVTSSWVRKAMYRQEVLGGPIVQSTGFGQSKQLKTVIEDGKFKHFETMIPMPKQIRRLLINENGEIDPKYYSIRRGDWNFAEITKRLKEVGAEQMLRVLLYRIPTESKYSIFPCQVVGFVPEDSSTVWLPDDGTTIAGFDFDTDKLFAIMKEFAFRDDKILFRHDNGNAIEYTPDAKSNYGKMAGYNNVLFDLQWLSLTTLQSASEIFDPGNFEDLTELSYRVELKKAIDNSGNHLYTKEEIDAMDADQLKDAWEDLNDLDITDIRTMTTLHSQNMCNKDMLGIAAVANISHAQISMFTESNPIYHNIGKNTITVYWKDKQELNRVRELQNLVINERDGNVPMDQRLDFNGELISKYLRKYIGAAADGAKNPTLSRLGVDKVTFPVIQWLLRAGVPMRVAHLFTSLPVFSELSAVYSMMNDDEKTSVNKAINKLEQMIFETDKQSFNGFKNAYEYRSAKYLNEKGFAFPLDITLDETELNNALYDNSKINALAQFHLLEQFRLLSKLASEWTTLSDYGRINSAVAGPKSSIEENTERANKVLNTQELFDDKHHIVTGMKFEEFASLMPYETQMRSSIESLLEAIQGDLFPSYQSPTYDATLDLIGRITGKSMSAELKEKFNRAQKMMALAKSGYEIGGPDFIMMYDDGEINRFFKDFADHYERELKELKALNEDLADFLNKNILLNLIGEPVDATVSVPIKLLNTQIFGADDTYKYQITMSWQDLLDYNNEEIGDEGNSRVHELGLDLFRYFTLRNMGKDFNAKTPWHLTPLDLKLMIPGYNNRLKDPQGFASNETTLALQFILNNATNPDVLTQINPQVFGIEDLKPTGVIDLSYEEAMDLFANKDIAARGPNATGYKTMFYCGANSVLILGNRDDIRNGFVDPEPFTDEETGVMRLHVPYHFVSAMGIPDVIEEYYPYLRNSIYGFYNPAEGTFFDDSEYKQGNLSDFESERKALVGYRDLNVNEIVNEVLSDMGFKFSDYIAARQENFSVSNIRMKNYMRLSDGALMQKLGFKKPSTDEEKKTQKMLLDAIRERLENKRIC